MNYDVHLFTDELARIANKEKYSLKVIAKNKERFLAVYFHHFIFIDSFSFLPTSLANLVSSLKTKGTEAFKYVKEFAGTNADLFFHKGVFCYDFLDSTSKLTYPHLPKRSHFYDSLKSEDVSEEDYEHALHVWETFDCHCLKDYMNLYLQSDVLLLCDVFESFRTLSIKNYSLDPSHYISLPSFGFDALLKFTYVKLDLLSCIDKYNFVTCGIRGGISSIMHRYAEANNPHLTNYDPEDEDSYKMYFDCTNLYGYAMTKPLPVKDFCWLTSDEINSLEINSVLDSSKCGYILEVDLEYPPSLHDMHNCYPLAPEKMSIEMNEWSPWLSNVATELGLPLKTGVEKLILTLRDKKGYILHYTNLKLYLKLGLKLSKIHRVLTFKQEPWMAPFIEFNTDQRKQATTTFEQDFWKLLFNSAYGKLLEDVKKRIDINLVSTQKRFLKLSSKPNFHTLQIINKRLVAVQMKKISVMLNKPIICDFTVLELSKVHMYNFHYSYIRKLYDTNAVLLFTNTDSLCYHIMSDSVYRDILENSKYFDTSNYEQDSTIFSERNKKK